MARIKTPTRPRNQFVLHEGQQDAVFILAERNVFDLESEGVVCGVQHDSFVLQDSDSSGKIVSSTQQGVDFRHKHASVKGLGDKVAGPHVHGHDDIHVVGSGGNENDRYLGHLPDLAAPVVAIEKGQRNIQQHQMRIKGRKFFLFESSGRTLRAVPTFQPGSLLHPRSLCHLRR